MFYRQLGYLKYEEENIWAVLKQGKNKREVTLGEDKERWSLKQGAREVLKGTKAHLVVVQGQGYTLVVRLSPLTFYLDTDPHRREEEMEVGTVVGRHFYRIRVCV